MQRAGEDLGASASPKTARLFATGGSQAVRLPAEFRFEGDQVYVRRDPLTGDVILSSRPRSSWREFVALRAQLGPLGKDEVLVREQSSAPRDPFEGWTE
jgi:antitoxin VapB